MNVVALRFYVLAVGLSLPDARVTRVSSLNNAFEQLEASRGSSDHFICALK